MTRMKKMLMVVISLILALSMSIPSSALFTTAQEKAEALSRINILRGSAGNYRLNEQLSRSEAAAFIVRLIGKEEYVLNSGTRYRKTNFTDVPESAWFAPYVGYLTHLGYLSGGTDGKFHPNAFITEKAFLKILLCSLGYVSDVDFDWNGIYRKTVEIGLITDLYYIARTADNTNYTRAEAIDVLYNALSTPTKGTDVALFRQLIQSGDMSKESALLAGLIYDTVRTEIKEIVPEDMNTVAITFNEEIVEVGSVYLYRSSEPENKQVCSILGRTANQIVIQTIPQIPLRDYTIEVSNVKDTEGNTIPVVSKSFLGFVAKRVSSPFFRISIIQPETSRSAQVIFTHPVNKNSEIVGNYRILENNQLFADGKLGDITVRQLGTNPNGVLLTLNNKSFNPNATYTLEIEGRLLSAYGAQMNNGKGDEMKFIPGEGELERFKLVGISTTDSETIKVEFNKEINPFIAQQIFNFYVTDESGKPIQVRQTAVEQVGRYQGRVLYINLNGKMEKDKSYNLTINHLNDITRQETITEQVYSFIAYFTSNEGLGIASMVFPDSQTIEIVFNRPLESESAMNTLHYTIKKAEDNKLLSPMKVYHDINSPEKVKLYFSSANALETTKQYELRVSGSMKDYTGRATERTSTVGFSMPSGITRTPLNYSEISPVSHDSLKITFNKEVSLTEKMIKPENFILENNLQGIRLERNPIGVIYLDARTMILKFDELLFDMDYTLRVLFIRDYAELERVSTLTVPFVIKSDVYSQ